MANVINATSTGNGGLVSTGDDSGILNIQTNETTAITVDASQNVGIGTASPTNRLSIVTASGSDGIVSVKSPTTETAGVLIDGGSTSNKGALLTLAKDATTKWRIGLDSAIGGGTNNNLNILGSSTDALLFGTNASERMRITSAGNVCVATTSQIDFGLISAAANLDLLYHLVLKNTATQAGGQSYQRFLNSANAKTGSIDHTGTTTVAYTTSSDYRMKENIAPMTGALTAVLQLKPCTYTWKEDGKVGQGFIAHELQEVCPDCVSGEKDAVETYTDEDGNEATRPAYQGIDTSFLVATLTAAIQELKAEVDELKAKVNA